MELIWKELDFGFRETTYKGWKISSTCKKGIFLVSSGNLGIGKYPLKKAIKKIDGKQERIVDVEFIHI